MTVVMAYPYPPPTSGPDVDNSHPNMLEHYQLPSISTEQHHLPPPNPQQPMSPGRHRALDMISKGSKVRRSISTPNVRRQAAADALSAEKRRNKLGYHRTSVACGHCRRRKIRCIPAPGDLQNRCSNCIRLKKECNFFPVDQQPLDPNQKGSNPHAINDGDSLSPSPTMSSSQIAPGGLSYSHLNMPTIQDLGGPLDKRPRNDSFSPDGKAQYGRPGDFDHSSSGWAASESSAAPTKAGPEVPSPYWRVNNEPPFTSNYPTYATQSPASHSSNWSASAIEPSPRDGDWSAPQRSMSYGHLEGLPPQSAYQTYSSHQQPSNLRDEYPPRSYSPRPGQQVENYSTITHQNMNSDADPRDDAQSNLSGHPPANASQYPPPNNWGAYTYDKPHMPPPAGSPYSSWYGSSAPLPSQSISGDTISPVQYPPVPQDYNGGYYPPNASGR